MGNRGRSEVRTELIGELGGLAWVHGVPLKYAWRCAFGTTSAHRAGECLVFGVGMRQFFLFFASGGGARGASRRRNMLVRLTKKWRQFWK